MNRKLKHSKKVSLNKKIISITVALSLLFLMLPVSFAEIQAIPERQTNACHEAHESCANHCCCGDHACSHEHSHSGIATAEAEEAENGEDKIINEEPDIDEEVVNDESSDREDVDQANNNDKKTLAYNLSEIGDNECYWTGEGKFEDGEYHPSSWFDSECWTTSDEGRVPLTNDDVCFGYDADYEGFYEGDSTVRIIDYGLKSSNSSIKKMYVSGNVNVILFSTSSVTIDVDDIIIDDGNGKYNPSLYLGNNVKIRSSKDRLESCFKNEITKKTGSKCTYSVKNTKSEYHLNSSGVDWHNPESWDEETGYIPWCTDTAILGEDNDVEVNLNTDIYLNKLCMYSNVKFVTNISKPCFFVLDNKAPFDGIPGTITIGSDNIYFKIKCDDIESALAYFDDSEKSVDYLYDDPDGYKIIGPKPTHTHDYRYQYTVDPTCSTGGYDVSTCTNADGRCDQLEKKENYTDPTGNHVFTNYEEVTPASCFSEGIEVAVCEFCGVATDTRTIERTDHTPSEIVYENPVEATCSEEGSFDEVVYCTVCNAELSRITIKVEKTDHTPGEIVRENVVNPTCTTDGSYDEVVYCTVCEVEISRETKTIASLGHTASERVKENEVAPTCSKPGSYDSVIYCAVCGEELSRETIYTEIFPHTPKTPVRENEVAPTCTAKGSYDEVTYCNVCGEVLSRKAKEIAMLPHTPGEAAKENDVEATCTTEGSYDIVVRCTVCNEILESEHHVSEKRNHTESDKQIENSVEATCTENGSYDEVKYCTVCNVELSRNKVIIPATGHTAGKTSMEDFVAASCANEGHYSMVKRCAVCGEELERETIIVEKLPHNPGTSVKENEVEPTPTEDGSYDEVVYCTECNTELTRTTIIVPSPEQHNPGTPVQENLVESTCTQAGHYDLVTYCQDCGKELNREFVEMEKLPHSPGKVEKENIVDATCVIEGSYDEVTYCSECQGAIKSEHKTIAAKGHTAKAPQKENEVDSTCTVPGHYDLVTRCSVCDEILENESHTKELADHVPGSPHRQNVVDATCTVDGSYDEVIYCENCNNEINRETKVIKATGHTPGEVVRTNEVDSTCKVAGHYDLIKYCTVCSAELEKETITKELLPHTPGAIQKENVVDATCTSDGSYDAVQYCTVCEAEISREAKTIAALGHTSGEPVKENETESTCKTHGKYDSVKYCAVCGEELSRETHSKELLPHTPGATVIENIVNATCEQEGSYDEVTYCSECNAELLRQGKTTPATGHDWKTTYDTDENGHWHSCTKCDAVKDKGDHVYPNATIEHYICTECIYNNIPGAKKDTCDAFDTAAGENPFPVVAEYVKSLKDQVNALNALQAILNLQKSGVQDIENLKTDEEVAATFDGLVKALPDVTDDTNIGNVENAFNYVKDAYDLLTASQKAKITTEESFISKYSAFTNMEEKIVNKVSELEAELDKLAGDNPSDEMKEILANYKEQLQNAKKFSALEPIAKEAKEAIETQKTDEEGAAKADELIQEIGNIDMTCDTAVVGPKVKIARVTFNSLSLHAQSLVKKTDVLEKQESNLQELEVAIEKAKEEARAEIEKQAGPKDQRTPEMQALVDKKLAELESQTSLAKVEKVKEEAVKEVKEQAEKEEAAKKQSEEAKASESAQTSDSLAYAFMILSMLALAGGVVATRRTRYNK